MNGKTRGKRADEVGLKKKKKTVEKPEVPPELVVKPRRQFVDHGGDAKFKASFDGSDQTTLVWSKGGTVLSEDEDGHYKIYEKDGFHFLEVTRVTLEDNGLFTVTVENSAGSDSASAELDVFEKPQLLSRETEPSWETPLQDVTSHIGDDQVELECVCKDLITPDVQWFHNEKEIFSGFHMKIKQEGQTTSVLVKRVRETDAGQFKCVMSGGNGNIETSCVLSVMPAEKLTPPVFVKELHDMEVEDGDKLELVVEVKGTDPVQVFWFHNNEEITLANPHFLLASLGSVHTLTLPHASAQCAGEFVCEAYNDCGDTDTFCVIDVKELDNPELPHFIMRPSNSFVSEGHSTTFTCKIKGQPMPTVTWEREGVEITNSSKHKTNNIKELHSLTIYDVESQDRGEYTCHLHNTQGNTSHSFQLFIQSHEQISGGRSGMTEGGTSSIIPESLWNVRDGNIHRSQTERLERKEIVERPKYSQSSSSTFTSIQPHNHDSGLVLNVSSQPTRINNNPSSITRLKFESSFSPDQESSQNVLQNSPLFQKAKERSNTKGFRSLNSSTSGFGSATNDSTAFFGSGTVDFTNRDRKELFSIRAPFTARETSSKGVVENSLRSLQVERNFRNVLSRGGEDSKTSMNDSVLKNDTRSGSVTQREMPYYTQSRKKSMSPLGLKAVNKSLDSLGKQNVVLEFSKKTKSEKPVYSPSSSLKFDSDDEVTGTSKSKADKGDIKDSYITYSKENSTSLVHSDEVFQAEKRPTNMFTPTEKPFHSPSSEPVVLQHARLISLKKPSSSCNVISSTKTTSSTNVLVPGDANELSSSSHRSVKDRTTIPNDDGANSSPNYLVSKSFQISKESIIEVNGTRLVENSERKDSIGKSAQLHRLSQRYNSSETKNNENNINKQRPPSKTDSTNSEKESGSVFTWGKRVSKTKDEMIQDTKSVSAVVQVTQPTKSSQSMSESGEKTDFRNVKLKPTQKIDVVDVKQSDNLRKTKFMSKSTENVFADMKLRPVSKDSGNSVRPVSDFIPENVGRLRLKSKSTNLSEIASISSPRAPSEKVICDSKKDTHTHSKILADLKAELKPSVSLTNISVTSVSKIEKKLESKTVTNKYEMETTASGMNQRKNGSKEQGPTSGRILTPNGSLPKTDSEAISASTASNPSEFMDKIRKWKTSLDFSGTEKIADNNGGAQTARNSGSDAQTRRVALTSRQSNQNSSGASHLDKIPDWVKQKALNKRSSLQLEKNPLSNTLGNNCLNCTTWRDSALKSGELNDENENKKPLPLNETFHCFNSQFKNRIGNNVESETRLQSNVHNSVRLNDNKNNVDSSIAKTNTTSRQIGNLKLSSNLGHQRSAPDLKERTNNENKPQSELSWINRKPIKNIEQKIKANSQSKLDKDSKEEEKPEWMQLKSPREIKSFRLTTTEATLSSSLSPASSKQQLNDLKNHNESKLGDKKHTTARTTETNKELRMLTSENESKVNTQCIGSRNKDLINQLVSLPSISPNLSLKSSPNMSPHSSPLARRHEMNVSTHSTVPKMNATTDKSKTELEKSINAGVEQSYENTLKSNSSSCKSTLSQPLTTLPSSQSSRELENKMSTTPTPSSTKDQALLSSDKTTTGVKQSLKERQTVAKKQNVPNKELTKTPIQQKKQLTDQQPLKNTPVRPSWMKQKSLRHIPIYPINDNELSPRYEPFRKSMDDTSSTNSVSSLASDASGLTTDSGYCKSVLTDDTIHGSKEMLLDRSQLDVDTEDNSSYGDEHKSASTDNVFKLATSDDGDADSGFCPELDMKKEDEEQDQVITPKASETGPNLDNRGKYSKCQNHQSPQMNDNNIQKIERDIEDLNIDDRNATQDLKSKHEADFKESVNDETDLTQNGGVSRTPKSEFLRRRLSGIQSEQSTKEKTNPLKTANDSVKPAIRPNILNITPVLGNRFITNNTFGGGGESVDRSKVVPSSSRNTDNGKVVHVSKILPRDKRTMDLMDTTQPAPDEKCPTFETPLNDVSVPYGSKAIFTCHVIGTPTPEIQWLHERKPLEKSSKATSFTYSSVTGQCSLTVLETFADHTGTYSCLASNSAGSVTTSAKLTIATSKKSDGLAIEGPVSLPPRILSLTPKAVTLSRQSTLILTLSFVGEPAPTVTWKKGQKDLVHGDGRVSIVTDKGSSILTIDHLTGMDTGKVTAAVTSSIGSDQSSANVCVEDIPGPPLGKPHVYGINRESASLSWCGPSSCGGSNINYYVIEAKTRQQIAWDVLVPQCKELSYHVFGLKPSVTYQFRVRAANKEGLGPPSEPSERVITSDPFSPSLESEGNVDVFTPSVEYRRADELPFEPRDVQLNKTDKFDDLYDIGPVVGKGKFGIVYKCTQKSDKEGRTWAAKVLKCREKDKATIRQEVEIMNRLRHPKLLMLWDAFEAPRQMVLVMEFIGAGELFERVIGEDFVLTERDCIHFVRQICEGVNYMHSSHVLHLDLKPENILCIAENSNRIKIIDFGLARIFRPGDITKVMLGTPEFIAPEVINYDEIGFGTDMWSIGVICYVLLSGLSPFLGDNDAETLSNVTMGDFDFDDEAFDEISDDAKDFISNLLVKRKEKRLLTEDCSKHSWLAGDEVDGMRYKRLNTDRLKHFMVRRKWLKTGNAVLAVSRLMKTTSLSSFMSRSDSTSTYSNSPTLTPHSIDLDDGQSNSIDLDNGQSDTNTSSTPGKLNGDVETSSTTLYKDQNDNKVLSEDISEKSENNDTTQTPSNNSSIHHNHNEDSNITKVDEESQSGNDNMSSTATSSSASEQLPSPISSSSTLCSSSASISSSPSHSPSFTREMSDSKACIRDVVRFDVVVTGIPCPDVSWYFEEELLTKDSKYSMEYNQSKGTCSLIIRSIEYDDDGEYSCKAVNSVGEAVCVAELSVLEI